MLRGVGAGHPDLRRASGRGGLGTDADKSNHGVSHVDRVVVSVDLGSYPRPVG